MASTKRRKVDKGEAMRCLALLENLPPVIPKFIHDNMDNQRNGSNGDSSNDNSVNDNDNKKLHELPKLSKQDLKERAVVFKERGRNLKHWGDRHYQLSNDRKLNDDQQQKLKILSGLELLDAVLIYAYAFWCEDTLANTPILVNWQSLGPLAKFNRSKWDQLYESNNNMAFGSLQSLAMLLDGLISIQISSIESNNIYHKCLKLQKTRESLSLEEYGRKSMEVVEKSIEYHHKNERGQLMIMKSTQKFPSTALKTRFPQTWAKGVNNKRVKFSDFSPEHINVDDGLSDNNGCFAYPLLEGGFNSRWWPHLVLFGRSILDEFSDMNDIQSFYKSKSRGYDKLKS